MNVPTSLGNITCIEDVESLTLRELALVYNELSGSSIKRFGTKSSGVKRVWATVQAENAGPTKKNKDAVPTKKSDPVPTRPGAEGVGRRKALQLSSKSEIKGHRDGTKRATAITLMKRTDGATFDEMMEATGWNYKTCYEGVKLVNTYVGYGLQEDETGRVKITQ